MQLSFNDDLACNTHMNWAWLTDSYRGPVVLSNSWSVVYLGA